MGGNQVVVMDGAMISAELAQKIGKLALTVGDDLQKIIGMTDFIHNELRRGAFSFPEDRNPCTVAIASNPFSTDPAATGGLVTAGPFQVFAEYEVPEHRIGRVLDISGIGRITTVLGAAQEARVEVRLIPASGGEPIVQRIIVAGFAAAAGTQLFLPGSIELFLLPRWKLQIGAVLTAGAGAMKLHCAITGYEYNK